MEVEAFHSRSFPASYLSPSSGCCVVYVKRAEAICCVAVVMWVITVCDKICCVALNVLNSLSTTDDEKMCKSLT